MRAPTHLSTDCRKAKLPILKFRVISELDSYHWHPLENVISKNAEILDSFTRDTSLVLLATILGLQMFKQQACNLELKFVFVIATAIN